MAEWTAPSEQPGMGPVLHEEWCSFRVWAPNAQGVSLVGSFNSWADEQIWLEEEDQGYWSADVRGVRPGDTYKYVINNGEKYWRADPCARQLTNSAGDAVVHAPQFAWEMVAPYGTPAWSEMVIYELHVGTFNDVPGGGPGSFGGIIARLDYLRDLGINAIELMPSMEFTFDFSWGYNPAWPFAIESSYGGPWALKELVKAAHERGIAVIFDVVYNHFGPQDLEFGLWRFDGWGENDKGGIYFYNDWRSATQWCDTRPDYGREEVRQYIRDNALMWLEEYQMDGLRWDATSYIHNVYGDRNNPGANLEDGWRLMQWVNSEIDQRQPWKLSIAEDMSNNQQITEAVGSGGAGFDAQWDAGFVHPVREALIYAEDGKRSMRALRDAIHTRYNGDAFRRVIYTESHDEVANGKRRLPEEIWPANAGSWYSRKRSTLGAALVFTAPGIPMIFQGQEFLEDKWFDDRDPLDWTRTQKYAGILELYRAVIRLRRNWYDTTRGLRGQHITVHHVNEVDKVLAFHRWDHGGPRDDVIVVINAANRSYDQYTIGVPQEGLWRVRFNSDSISYSSDFGNHQSNDAFARPEQKDNMPFCADVGIGPYTAVILSQNA